MPGWPPHLAVNLQDSGAATSTLTALGPAAVWAYGLPGAPLWRDDEHEVLRWCRLLEGYGISCDPGALGLRTPAEEPPAAGLTVVHPGTDAGARWPASRWAAVAEQLHAAGHEVVITGSEQEEPLARAVTAGAGLPPGACLAGRLVSPRPPRWSRYARLVLCGDAAVGHLATAYRTPSILLLDHASVVRTGPPADRPEHQVLPGDDSPAPSLLDVEVDQVLAAVGAPAR